VTTRATDVPAFPADVSVAVVTHNSGATIDAVLAAIAATGCPAERTFVVDVASTDGTRDRVLERLGAPQLLTLPTNEGPNPARNLALSRSPTPYLLLVDSDVFLEPGAPAALRAEMNGARVAVAAPVVVHAATPEVIQYAGGGLHFICEAVNPWMDRPVGERGTGSLEIGAAPGAALLVDCAAAAVVGGFDERYFLGKEDGDFLHRLRIAGYHLRESGHARIRHQTRPRTTWLFMYQVRNRWHFLLRNYQARTLIVLAPALAVHELLQLAALTAKGHAGAWLRAWRSLMPMLRTLGADRTAVAAYRRTGDRRLLRDDPLVVRADLGGAGGLKRLYDAWLRVYWRLASPLLDGRA
jgi:GT2 family glycosyltransferase